MSDTIPFTRIENPAPDVADCMAEVEALAVEQGSFQECHGTADTILNRLGGQPGAYRTGWTAFKTDLQRETRGIYRVDIRVPAHDSDSRWDHTFAVLKIGDGTVIYQAFQGAYSLSQWLNQSAGPHAQRYAATNNEPLARERVQEFFLGVDRMLQHFVNGKEPSWMRACFCGTPDYEAHADSFYDDAITLFGAPAARRNLRRPTIQNAIRAGSVEVRWKRAEVKDLTN